MPFVPFLYDGMRQKTCEERRNKEVIHLNALALTEQQMFGK